MKLNRRYRRNIRSDLSFYTAATLLTIVTLFMFYLFNIAGNGIKDFSGDFFAEHKIEDAGFSTYRDITDGQLEEAGRRYDAEIERQGYVNVEEDGFTARVFDRNSRINLCEITEGSDISRRGDILISEGYARNMGIKPGDSIMLRGENHKVTGFFQRPDYLYMLESPDDTYKNVSSFFLAYVHDDEYRDLGQETVRYAVRYGDEGLEKDFRKYINDRYIMKSYMPAAENTRINMVDGQADLFIDVSYMVLVIVPLIAVILISITMSRKVKQEQKIIGTLTSMGYRRSQLMRHYAGFAAIPGILGGTLTSILAFIFAQPYGEMGLADYEPMHVEFTLSPLIGITGIIVPTVMYTAASLLSTRKLLSRDPVSLLSGNSDGKAFGRRILVRSSMSFRKKFAIRSILGNPARTFVILLGIFLGSYIMLFGFSIVDSVNSMAGRIDSQTGTFRYEYILNGLHTGVPEEGDPVITSKFESEDGYSVPLTGAGESDCLDLKDTEGRKISLDDGFFVTRTTAYLYDLEKGDDYVIYDPATMEKETLKVEGVLDNDVQKGIFTSREAAAELLDISSDTYNAVISDTAIDMEKGTVAETVEMSSVKDQGDTLLRQMAPVIYLFIFIGMIICVSAIFVAVNMLITENRNSISMLKVLGYDDRKIDNTVLNINHILVPAGILLSIPLVYITGDHLYIADTQTTGLIITTVISARSFIISIACTLASYFGSIAFMSRKVRKVNMVESIKNAAE